MRKAVTILIAVSMFSGCVTTKRPDRSLQDLVSARQADDIARSEESGELADQLFKRAEVKADAFKNGGNATRPTLDVLVISGGGDWGAFGAGVLKGWGRVAGEAARPKFDVVTGVSTGALIAPFAFLGDDESIERIVQLYRNPQKDWTKKRGLLFFWPTHESLYTMPGLEREMRVAMDRKMLERIAAEDGTGRLLAVNTTNVDFGEMRGWNIVAEAKAALATNDEDRVQSILLASAGIPAVFPPREIGPYLYVDGAITGNIMYGGRVREDQSLPAEWDARHAGTPMPLMRYWVIFNNQLRFAPQVTRMRWPDIMSRATIMSTQTSTVNSLRHLFAQAEIARLKYNADVEVRIIAVPDTWVPPKAGTFVPEVMNALADLGEQMGADPTSWRSEAP